jgi:2-polyprenyl-6-methoxyphenol hydroxylase-like FAD-dependent oxidoreductase
VPYKVLKIAVAGGSIGGLCAGLALNGAGFGAQVYERDPGPMNTRGAGIVVQEELTQLLRAHEAPSLPTTSCSVRRYLDPDFTSWEAIYTMLRSVFPAARYHMGAALSGFEDREGGVAVDIDGVGRLVADLLVCADGAQSASRRRLLPDVTPSYAGYVAWRGTLDEADAPAELVRFFDDAFTFCETRTGGHILNYFIPGDGAAVTVGRRRLNWVWYVMANEADLATLLVDRDGRRHHASLPQGGASDTPFATFAISHGARSTRCWPHLSPRRPIRLSRRSSMLSFRKPSSAGSAFWATPLSSSGRIPRARRRRPRAMRRCWPPP